MKKIKLISLLITMCILTQFAYSQIEVGQIPMESNRVRNLFGTSDNKGTFSTLYYQKRPTNDEVGYLILKVYNEKLNVISNVKYLSHSRNLTSLGIKVTKDKYIYYFENSKNKTQLYAYAVEKYSAAGSKEIIKTRNSVNFLASTKERLITSVSDQGEFYIVTSNKKSSEINILRFQDDKIFDKKVFKVDPSLNKILRKVSFDVLKKEDEKTITKAKGYHKIYVPEPGKLILTLENVNSIDGIFGKTQVLVFDLNNEKFKSKIISNGLSKFTNNSNSFVDNNKLYKLTLNSDLLDLSIYSLEDFKLVKNYKYGVQDSIVIKTGNVIRSSNGVIKNEFSGSTKKLIKKLRYGGFTITSICVNEIDSNEVVLDIGTWGEMSGSGVNFGPGAGAISAVSFHAGGAGIITYFRTFLNKSTLTKTKTEQYKSIGEKIKKHTDKLDAEWVKNNSMCSFSYLKNVVYFLHIDKEKKKLVVNKFIKNNIQ